MKILIVFVLFLTYEAISGNPSCPTLKGGAINVHLICHTHDDVGWLKTVDQYYYGAKKKITWVGVQYILDSVLESLKVDVNRKFIYVESAFFYMWWNEQNAATKNLLKKFVDNGQFEFIGGGWSMNDEAAAHYNAIIDQMSLGLRRLNRTFGDVANPRIAWQIDPFGHSKEQASLFAQMGMEGLFFGRLDHADKTHRWNTKQMEIIWKGSNDIGKDSWLFTGALPNGYSPPKGFCFDLLCPNDPIMDDPKLEESNVQEKVKDFLDEITNQSEGYATDNLIMTMGEDFNYVNANSWYKNLDKLIKHVNGRQVNGKTVNLVYSTPSCYLDALHASRKKWPTKTDDFFPYSSDPHAYWTGYFTSRPSFKGYVRKANNILQIVKQVSALSGSTWDNRVNKLAESMGIAQHHDAITGTAKQPVSDDYTRRLAAGIAETHDSINKAFRSFTNTPLSTPEFRFCPLLNTSSCPFTENEDGSFVITVYNPLAHPRNHYVRIPVTHNLGYKVLNSGGRALDVQLIPISEAVRNIPGRESSANFELIFYAESLPALGYEQFLVQPSKNKILAQSQKSLLLAANEKGDTVIKKGKLRVTLDRDTKLLKTVSLISSKKPIKVSQEWFWYAGHAGDNIKPEKRASGAYIFRPNSTSSYPIVSKAKVNAIYDGMLVAEIHQEFLPWVTQIIRLYKDYNYIETDWLVGPIPIEDKIGKEIVTRYTIGQMKTDKVFYTDSNGRQMMKRTKDYRPTWTLTSTEPISQNYYPVTSRILLHSSDNKDQAGLLNDRAQGGTSMRDGQMELMVHRRLLFDDAFGVGEPLNETAYGKGLVVRGQHYFIHSSLKNKKCDFACQHRSLAQQIMLRPIYAFQKTPKKSSWDRDFVTKNSFLTSALPANIHLLTLEPWQDGQETTSAKERQWLLRLEHFYQRSESPKYSKGATVDVKNMFAKWNVLSIKETNLSANKWKKDEKRLQWTPQDHDKTVSMSNSGVNLNMEDQTGVFEFEPMQIRTFVITVAFK